MRISEICISNFKGVGDKKLLQLRPITIVIGPNSSGKSSFIHALAALSQTVKLANNIKPLILDDDQAYVHLGRFIDVIHSKSYQDSVQLGISIDDVPITNIKRIKGKTVRHTDHYSVKANYDFKCTKRTQEIYLDSSSHVIGDHEFLLKKQGASYTITDKTSGSKKTISALNSLFIHPIELFAMVKGDQDFLVNELIRCQEAIRNSLAETLYLGPFRQPPQRMYPSRSASPSETGALGESTIPMLAQESIQSRSRKHINQVANWLKYLGVANKLDLSRVGASDVFDVTLTLPDDQKFSIADLGYGTSQVLPVLTQCSFSSSESTLLFEQPELHLHSLSARKLAKVFIDTINEKKSTIIIETHSPELVKEFICQVRDKYLDLEDFIIYKASRVEGQTTYEKVEIESEDGYIDVIDNWEKGVSI